MIARFLARALCVALPVVATACAGVSRPMSPDAGSLRLALLGQALVEHDPRGTVDDPLGSLHPLLRDADLVFTNFEGAVNAPGCVCAPTRAGEFLHGAPPAVLDFLRASRVTLLSLANNHAWDYGTDGVVATLDAARARGFQVAGTGRTLAEASAPVYVTVRGVRVAMVAMATVRLSDSAMAGPRTAGVNLLRLDNADDRARNVAVIREARSKADVVIVYHHFQTVGTPAWQRAWAHDAIDAGGTIYVSHGEPTLSGVEQYAGRPVLYGLGNFIFQTKTPLGRYPDDVWESVVAELAIKADGGWSTRFTPVVLEQGVPGPDFLRSRGFPAIADSARGQAILRRLAAMSATLGTRVSVHAGWAEISR